MTEKMCCFFLKLETGCLLLGLFTFLLSTTKLIVAAVFVEMEFCLDPDIISKGHNISNSNATEVKLQHHILGLQLSRSVIEIVMCFIIIMMLLWMIFSVLLVIGILKKRVNFVVVYFLFGIFISILYLLSGLLELISQMWLFSASTILLTLVYMKYLTYVYAVYDKIHQEDVCSDRGWLIEDDIDDPIIEY